MEQLSHTEAQNVDSPAHVLEKLAHHSDNYIRYLVARNTSTPVQALIELARDPDVFVREAIAASIITPIQTLIELAEDFHEETVARNAIANENYPLEKLNELIEQWDEDYLDDYLLLGLAGNPSTPQSILIRIAQDAHGEVLGWLADNPNLPVDVLRNLSREHPKLRENVAENPNAPIDLLIELSGDPDETVRAAVAGNLKTPSEFLQVLAMDSDADVRASVVANQSASPEIRALAKLGT